MATVNTGLDSRGRRNTMLAAVAVSAFAAVVRLAFLTGTDFIATVAGDINGYLAYAWNLHTHGVYSSQPIDAAGVPASDTFRPPGYPLFLWLALQIAGDPSRWLAWATGIQLALGAATAGLTVLLGRQWLRPFPAIAAGLLVALWPHHVALSVTLLSETLLGFLLVLGLWLWARACAVPLLPRAAAAGLAFGAAILVNTLVLLLPPLLALATSYTAGARRAALMVTMALALPLAWSVAGPSPTSDAASSSGRALTNLVQGSWPQYHAAWRTRERNAVSRAISDAIDDEIDATVADPGAGLARVRERLGGDPGWYARWYLLRKPWLLWDWDIQLGWRAMHFLPVKSSPYERPGVMAVTASVLKAANPLLFALALAAVLATAWQGISARRRQATGDPPGAPSPTLMACVLLVVYVTVVHVVLQAEPRYSVPYRPVQLLLACHAVALVAAWLRRRVATGAARKDPDITT